MDADNDNSTLKSIKSTGLGAKYRAGKAYLQINGLLLQLHLLMGDQLQVRAGFQGCTCWYFDSASECHGGEGQGKACLKTIGLLLQLGLLLGGQLQLGAGL